MDIYPNHPLAQPREHLRRRNVPVPRRLDEVGNGLRNERSRTTSRVEYALFQWFRNHLPHHRAGQPWRSIVLAQRLTLLCRNDRLVQDGSYIRRRVVRRPVEPRDPAG